MFATRVFSTLIAATAIFAATARAQAPLVARNGESGSFLGYDVARCGDLDKDGYDDVIVGLPDYDDWQLPGSGEADVISGRTGGTLLRLTDPSATDFGSSVAGVGDINNDGTVDFAVGSPSLSQNGSWCGGVRLFSGSTGQIIYSWFGIDANDEASRVHAAGDVNGDGVLDIAIGAPYDEAVATSTGSVRVFSGKTGLLLRQLPAPANAPYWGLELDCGDIDGDGKNDIVVSAPNLSSNATEPGLVVGYSGANGSVLFTAVGPALGFETLFGKDVAIVHDANSDGRRDLLVSAGEQECAYLLSGMNGSVLHTFYGDALYDFSFGYTVDGIGDVNGNGSKDFLIASRGGGYYPTNKAGRVHVVDGATFATITVHRLATFSGDRHGVTRVIAIGDANGDGFPDYCAADPTWANGGSILAGLVTVRSTHSGSWSSEGSGCPGSNGIVPEIFYDDQACFVSNGKAMLFANKFYGKQPTLIVLGTTPIAQPMSGCSLLVQPLTTIGFTMPGSPVPGGGGFELFATIPLGTPAVTLYMQVFAGDPGFARGFAASQRVKINIE